MSIIKDALFHGNTLPRNAARIFILLCITMVFIFAGGHYSDTYKCSVTSTVPSANGALLIDTEEEKRATNTKKGDVIAAMLALIVACLCFHPVFIDKSIEFPLSLKNNPGLKYVALTGATALAAAWTSYTAQNLDEFGVLKDKDGNAQTANKDSTCKHPVGWLSAIIAWSPLWIFGLLVLMFCIAKGCKKGKVEKCTAFMEKIGVKV